MNHQLKVQVAASTLWSSVRMGSEQLLGFVIFLLLARLLSPDDFGVVALAVTVIELCKLIACNGLADAVIQTPELDEETANTALWSNVFVALILTGLVLLTANPLAAIFAYPKLGTVLQAVSPTILLAALGAIHGARITRAFGYKTLAIRSLASNLIGGAVAVYLAFAGYGLWSLVAQRIIAEACTTLLTWIAHPWLPRLEVSRRAFVRIWAFGANVALSGLLFTLSARVHELIIGFFLTVAAVGYFRVGWRQLDLLMQVTLRPINAVALPTFAALQRDRIQLERAYMRMLNLSALLTFPIFLGMTVYAPDLVTLVFGVKWLPSAEILQVLSLLVVPITLNYFATPVFSAAGRPQIAVRVGVVQLALGVMFALSAAPFGLLAIACSHVLRAYITCPYVLGCVQKVTGISRYRMLAAIAPPFFAAAAMAIVLFFARPAMNQRLGMIAGVACGIVLGAALYGIALATIDRRFLAEQVRFVWKLMSGKTT